MFDFIFLGVPALGGLLLLGGSIYQGVKAKRIWYVAPALFGLFATFNMVIAMISPASDTGTLMCVSTFGMLVLGMIVFSILQRRDQSQAAGSGR